MSDAEPRVVDTAGALPAPGAVLAIGNFDGVHVGHRALLRRMRERADAEGRPSGVLTFFPPAKAFFAGTPHLSSRAEKITLLRPFDPTAVAVVRFDADYALTEADAFLEELRGLRPHTIVVGEDFRFGRDRRGGLDELQHVPERMEVFRLLLDGEEPIKSSRIRTHLAAGEMLEVERLLGAPYLAHGRVVPGDRRGAEIGFPTANLDVPEGKALPHGVFAVRVDGSRSRHDGMANVGPRPSFPDAAPRLEVHLFAFEGDLYGEELTVHFLEHLRGQRRFGGLEDLTRQLARDREAAVAALARRDARAGENPGT